MSEPIKKQLAKDLRQLFLRRAHRQQHPEAASVFRKTASAMAMVNFCLRVAVGVKYFHFDSLYESEDFISLREVKK